MDFVYMFIIKYNQYMCNRILIILSIAVPVLSQLFRLLTVAHMLTELGQCLEEEEKFEEQYKTWMQQFQDWKEQNKGKLLAIL